MDVVVLELCMTTLGYGRPLALLPIGAVVEVVDWILSSAIRLIRISGGEKFKDIYQSV